MEKRQVIVIWMASWIFLLHQCELIPDWDPNTNNCYNINSTELIFLYDCGVRIDTIGYLHVVCDMFCSIGDEFASEEETSNLIISWGLRSDRRISNMSDPICLWLSNITIAKTTPMIQKFGTRFYLEENLQKLLNYFESGRMNIIYKRNESRMVGVANREGNCDTRSPHFSVSTIDDNKNTSCKLKIAGIADMVLTARWYNRTATSFDMLEKLMNIYLLDKATFSLIRVEFLNNSQFEKLLFLPLIYIKLLRLEMINTNFDSLLNYDFPDLFDLTELSFSRGVIESIEEEALDPLPNLSILDLSFNAMQSVPNQLYGEHLQKLWKLNMTGNKPKEGRSFLLTSENKSNSHLLVLSLSKTPIRQIKKRSFAPFPHLTHLYLDHCNLSNLDAEAFYNLSYLLILDLAANNIHSLPPDIFLHLISLKSLNLTMNKLTTTTVQQMHSFNALNSLYLKNNKKFLIDASLVHHHVAFAATTNKMQKRLNNISLKHLDLSKNRITIVSREMQFLFEGIERVNISMNPFDCNACPLYLVQSWLKKRNAECPNLFFCSTPNNLKDKEISELKSNAESCSKDYSIAIALSITFTFIGLILGCLVYFSRDHIRQFVKGIVYKRASTTNLDGVNLYDSL